MGSKTRGSLLPKPVNNINAYIENQKKEKQAVREQLKESIRGHQNQLQSGKYELTRTDGGKPVAYVKNKQNVNYLRKLCSQLDSPPTKHGMLKSKLRNFLHYFIKFNDLRIYSTDSIADGSIVMKTYNGDLKIIDLRSGLVKSILAEKRKVKSIEKTFKTFSKHFKIHIIGFNQYESSYIERLIDYKPFSDWTEKEKKDAIETIFSNFNSYFYEKKNRLKKTITVTSLISNLEKKAGSHNIIESIKYQIPESAYSDAWPKVKSHGDCVLSNVLLKDGQFYFIDWNDSGKYVFFYDLLNGIFGEAAFHNNDSFLYDYLTGEYDEHFSKAFQLFGLHYDQDKKLYYLAVFMLERILFRYKHKNDVHIESVLSIYERVLKKAEEINTEESRC
ncbi:hypothetical protein CR205_14890 [Alteribacter lacisalsi]|uniref:Aminoglycoside phosphotransferase domain-containing protein n=1 Tax=Alteribacter lacisalsi TaxID=2045244 RepID=A0A2W0H773_9BACI|nr:phosphotransferase [Alteribacter lacisalsi]PYZ96957.1 hypothetical protein CR205_14890 [Alteribacter lacisalsi]